MSDGIIFQNCQSGVDFENLIIGFLRDCGIEASSTGKEDKGIDIVASATPDDITKKYYIQCKY